MFDRIAGVYDRMNTVMTAGLHHQLAPPRRRPRRRWRPGGRALDVATGTGDLALELAAASAPGGEVVGADFSERMLELAREKASRRAGRAGASSPLRAGQRARAPVCRRRVRCRHGRLRRAQLLRSRARAAPRWPASSGPAGGWWCSRSRPRRVRRCRRSSSCGLTVSCRRSGGSPATPRPTATCRARCAVSRHRRSWRRRMCAAAGCGEIRYVLTAGGIIALHVGRWSG